jgi:hypothetical protein
MQIPKSAWKDKAADLFDTKSVREIATLLFDESGYLDFHTFLGKMYNHRKKINLKKTIKEINKITLPKSEVEEEKTPTITERINFDISKIQESAKYRELKDKYNFLLNQYEESEKRFDALVNIKSQTDVYEISPSPKSNPSQACPVIMLSDWHFEEQVDPQTINGLNEYNLEIATKRWNKCIQNSLKLVQKERHTSEINEIIIWLGGDFITGYIHEELEESNYLSPTQATRFAKEKIISALKFFREYGKFDKITVVCNYGNHGRTNKKPRVSTGYKNSYEWMMYNDVADYFDGDKKFSFVIPNGLFSYVNLYSYTLRFWHGDTVSYGGGIGGLTVPLIKAITRYDQTIKADYNFMGHYHQLFQATKNCIVNGSGIGFNAYAQRIGASNERALQGFVIIDKVHGMTIKTPIFCQ